MKSIIPCVEFMFYLFVYFIFQVCLLDNKTGLNVSVFLKQFKGGNKDVIEWIQTLNIQSVTVEQMTALEKLLPDTNTVRLHNMFIILISHNFQIDHLKSYNGDQKKLGNAEVFLLELIKIDK